MGKFLIMAIMFLLLYSSHQLLAAPQNVEENLKIAKSYEEKAQDLKKEIVKHEKMKRDFEKELGPGMRRSQVFRSHKIEKMKIHCDAIIRRCRELAGEYLKMADLYKMPDEELQKNVKPIA